LPFSTVKIEGCNSTQTNERKKRRHQVRGPARGGKKEGGAATPLDAVATQIGEGELRKKERGLASCVHLKKGSYSRGDHCKAGSPRQREGDLLPLAGEKICIYRLERDLRAPKGLSCCEEKKNC